ncbi:AKR_HP2_G0004100.mRNA.1.CDS.1 [Saccharomyces cerevisiae]|nr:AKR_HP2_G0004100.mRNA.1.CDS.1 [Saccharomyces cerevisiae]CAI6406689.1 AKR_HP2_G0004100.mRNA.1.CDS.1 [Saccharomyces cerevisiae]
MFSSGTDGPNRYHTTLYDDPTTVPNGIITNPAQTLVTLLADLAVTVRLLGSSGLPIKPISSVPQLHDAKGNVINVTRSLHQSLRQGCSTRDHLNLPSK